jgi:hypothetical protein
MTGQTTVAIRGEDFWINGAPTSHRDGIFIRVLTTLNRSSERAETTER